jgi:hypothetical protein
VGFVQSVNASASAGTSLTATLGTAATAGTCLVACVGTNQDTTNPVVSGIKLNTNADHWASAKSLNSNTAQNCEIWTDQSNAGAQTAVVITFTAGTGTNLGMSASIIEWSQVLSTGAVDKTNGQTDATTSTTWSSLATGTLSQNSEVIFAAVQGEVGTAFTINVPGVPWTNLAQITPVTGVGFRAGYQGVNATSTQTYNSTFSVAAVYSSVIVSLKMQTSIAGVIAMDGGGTMHPAGGIAGAAVLHGGGSVQPVAGVLAHGALAMHGGGTVEASGSIAGALVMHGGGNVQPVATATGHPVAAMRGGGTMQPDAVILGTIPAAAVLHGGGTMEITGNVLPPIGGGAGMVMPRIRYRRRKTYTREYSWITMP